MSTKNDTDSESRDPRTKHPSDLSNEKQPYPGYSEELSPNPDHGESSYTGSEKLKDNVALITGGDSGIGRAVAIAYAREGAHVAISFLEEERADAETTAEWVHKARRDALLIPGDLRDQSYCASLIDKVIEYHGQLDILVNNAAFQMEHSSIQDLSNEEIERTFRTNIYAAMWLSRSAISHMKPGSSIINTTSIQAFEPSAGLLAYAATKAAILNFTKGFSKEAIKSGVRVNAVAPGPVWTPLIPATLDKEHLERFGKQTAFGRAAQPAELAPLYVFLASKQASYMTGEVISATGGRSPL